MVSCGFLEEPIDGLVPTSVFAQVVRDRATAFGDEIRSTLGQAATAAFRGASDAGWGVFGEETLPAQGRASAM